jgi:hypothetical protein
MKNSFILQLKASTPIEAFEKISNVISDINEAKEEPKSAEEILRNENIKVKNRILTDFGTQFELFKKPNKDDLEKLFKKDNLRIKGNFIFILE